MPDSSEVPFYDRDGEHVLTVEIELNADGAPPERVTLTGPDEGGGIQCQYRREHRPGSTPPWAYVEVSRTRSGEPAPGSPEALQRLLDSEIWRPTGPIPRGQVGNPEAAD